MLKILSNTSLTIQAWLNQATRIMRRRYYMRKSWYAQRTLPKRINSVIPKPPERQVWWLRDDFFSVEQR